jgi:hypothetical protein
MRAFNTCVAMAAMLVALVSAPLFHFHDWDEHASAPLLHAHFSTPASELPHSEHAVEAEHSDDHERSIDFLAVNTTATPIFHAVMEFSEMLPVPSLESQGSVNSVETVRAHSPPGTRRLIPRSPPLA